MKIALIGATGFVGSAVVKEASQRGHDVTAIARHPEKVEKLEGITAQKTDVFDIASLSKVIARHDVVISTYNPGWTEPDIQNLFIKGSQATIEAVKRSGTKRLIIVGGAGSLEAAPGVQLVDTPQFPAEWKQGALGAREALNIIRKESELEWTFVSPAIQLVPGDRTAKFRLGLDQPVFDEKGESRISVQDLAVALIDEAEKPKHVRKRFTLGY